jgi:hypothetical protein
MLVSQLWGISPIRAQDAHGCAYNDRRWGDGESGWKEINTRHDRRRALDSLEVQWHVCSWSTGYVHYNSAAIVSFSAADSQYRAPIAKTQSVSGVGCGRDVLVLTPQDETLNEIAKVRQGCGS